MRFMPLVALPRVNDLNVGQVAGFRRLADGTIAGSMNVEHGANPLSGRKSIQVPIGFHLIV